MQHKFKHVANIVLSMALTPLAGCGGGAAAPQNTYSVGGTVTGLASSGLELQLNGGDSLAVSRPGIFTFPTNLPSGAAYTVTVAAQPSSPSQICAVSRGSGTVAVANITDVAVDCAPSPFTTLVNQPPEVGELSLLLTDGTVMMQSTSDAGAFYRLTPDSNGSYANGTWSQLASPPVGYAPSASAQVVLADGRVVLVGGEYNQNQYALPFAPSSLTNMSAVYDPVTDHWTMIAPPSDVAYIGDVASVVMPDGSFVYGDKLGRDMWRLDPSSLSWSPVPSAGKSDDFAEEGWTLMPSGSIFTVDVGNPPHAEHFDPVSAQWYSDGNTPVGLTSPTSAPGGWSYGPAPVQVVGGITYGPGPPGVYFPPGEVGPALLLPDGRVFATGGASGDIAHTVLYTAGSTPADSGTFTVGPDFGPGDDAGDASAALLPSGHVLIATASGRFYEFDGTALTVTGALSTFGGTVGYFVLPLPSGEVLVTGAMTQIYAGHGSANPAWAPTITVAPTVATRGSTYRISGTQFNGLSQAAAVGDELTAATNYPLVRITNAASGHVMYARTHGHSTMGVATGSTLVSTLFDVPATAETGASSLVVVANGIASAPVSVTVN